jgi:hypothetical protein
MLSSFRPHLPLIALSCLSSLVIFYLYRELQRAKRSVACFANGQEEQQQAAAQGVAQDPALQQEQAEGQQRGSLRKRREEGEVKRVRFRESGAQGTLLKRRSVPASAPTGSQQPHGPAQAAAHAEA